MPKTKDREVKKHMRKPSSASSNYACVDEHVHLDLGGPVGVVLRRMQTGPVLINTGRPLFLLAVCRQTFWPALSDAWSKIGHHTAQ